MDTDCRMPTKKSCEGNFQVKRFKTRWCPATCSYYIAKQETCEMSRVTHRAWHSIACSYMLWRILLFCGEKFWEWRWPSQGRGCCHCSLSGWWTLLRVFGFKNHDKPSDDSHNKLCHRSYNYINVLSSTHFICLCIACVFCENPPGVSWSCASGW